MACSGVLKVLMVLFNSLIFLAGGAILVIGVLIELHKKNVLGVLTNIHDIHPEVNHLVNTSYLLIAVGGILTIMGFLGCCGACLENNCMLMTFFIIILLVFIMEVITAVLILLYQPKVEELLDAFRTKVSKNIKEKYGNNTAITNAWNQTMTLLKCCGYSNYTDFNDSLYVNTTKQYPQICCAQKSEICDYKHAAEANVQGCFYAVVEFVKSKSTLLGGVAVCVVAIEVAAMIASLILYKK